MNHKHIEENVLADFLKEANKNTYANKNAPKTEPSRLKSEDYHFEKGGLVYHDTYFGGGDFIGEEIIYQDGTPVWGANYYGFVLDESFDDGDIYDFLREALMQEYESPVPVRGPEKYDFGGWEYTFRGEGSLSRFTGQEEITFENKVIYRCHIHGGYIR